jgi:hypothetical protein
MMMEDINVEDEINAVSLDDEKERSFHPPVCGAALPFRRRGVIERN